ncbi:MAG: hypothetical protein AB8B74_06125 [Crocinitomicaceae bacterium]
MKSITKFSVFVLILSAISCGKTKPVTACIELDKVSISSGEDITFTSCSENEWSYIWEILGPDSAAENSLMWNDKVFTRTLETPGSYTVKLTTYSDFSFLGDAASESSSFTVN